MASPVNIMKNPEIPKFGAQDFKPVADDCLYYFQTLKTKSLTDIKILKTAHLIEMHMQNFVSIYTFDSTAFKLLEALPLKLRNILTCKVTIQEKAVEINKLYAEAWSAVNSIKE